MEETCAAKSWTHEWPLFLIEIFTSLAEVNLTASTTSRGVSGKMLLEGRFHLVLKSTACFVSPGIMRVVEMACMLLECVRNIHRS